MKLMHCLICVPSFIKLCSQTKKFEHQISNYVNRIPLNINISHPQSNKIPMEYIYTNISVISRPDTTNQKLFALICLF